jgi:hypothetical protein
MAHQTAALVKAELQGLERAGFDVNILREGSGGWGPKTPLSGLDDGEFPRVVLLRRK